MDYIFPNRCIKISGTAQDEIGNYDLSIPINGWINFSFIGTISFYETIGSYEEYTEHTLIINSALESTWNCINNACVDPMDGSGIYDDLNECEAICNSVIENSWNCVNNACVDPMDGSGIYDDLNECEAICNSVIEDSWNCVNNACVDPMDGSGIIWMITIVMVFDHGM